MTSQNKQFLDSAIVSTGSDITEKVEIKEGISKTARMHLARDILCSMLNTGSYGGLCGMREFVLDSYAIADMLIKEGGS